MNHQEIQISFLKELADLFKTLGFRSAISHQAFRKKTDFGKQSFHVSFIKHEYELFITGDVAIRFDALENLIHERGVRPFLTEKEKKEVYSFGCELGNLSGVGQKRWKIKDNGEVSSTVTNVFKEFVKVGVPYFERFSAMDECLKILSGKIGSSDKLVAIPGKKAINTIGLAYLLKNEEVLFNSVERERQYLESIDDQDLASFLAFAGDLSSKLQS